MFHRTTFLAVILKKELVGRCATAPFLLQILTKDSVTISVDGVVYYRVQNATLAVANITNADSATRLLAQTTLRNVLGTKNLSQILSDREEIAHNMQVRRVPGLIPTRNQKMKQRVIGCLTAFYSFQLGDHWPAFFPS